MAKQFTHIEDFNAFLKEAGAQTVDQMLWESDADHDARILQALTDAGYTDLDNLVWDGHGYELFGHTNNGWLYQDEVDWHYLASVSTPEHVAEVALKSKKRPRPLTAEEQYIVDTRS